jgi:hypothetical protein
VPKARSFLYSLHELGSVCNPPFHSVISSKLIYSRRRLFASTYIHLGSDGPTAVTDHHNLQDERPLPTTPLSPMRPPHYGCALTGHEFCPPNGRVQPPVPVGSDAGNDWFAWCWSTISLFKIDLIKYSAHENSGCVYPLFNLCCTY